MQCAIKAWGGGGSGEEGPIGGGRRTSIILSTLKINFLNERFYIANLEDNDQEAFQNIKFKTLKMENVTKCKC